MRPHSRTSGGDEEEETEDLVPGSQPATPDLRPCLGKQSLGGAAASGALETQASGHCAANLTKSTVSSRPAVEHAVQTEDTVSF